MFEQSGQAKYQFWLSDLNEQLSEEAGEHRNSNSKFFFLTTSLYSSFFEQHYKPGSVSDDHLSWLYVTAQLLCPVTRTERDQPGSTTGRRIASYSVLLRVEFTQPCLLPAKRWALTPPFHHHSPQAASCFFSVALVLESPPPDVIRHPALWSPDFPHQNGATVCAAHAVF